MNDNEIAEILKNENEEYRKLDEEHRIFKIRLAEIDKKKFLTAEDETERKKIQKQKLIQKDRMAEIIREYIRNHP
ncbi:MAG: DUF465 domain-containing protein [Nitrospirae bacterium]|nr:DUF465 domain-containing protein [Nitrospirota bacterium]